MTDNSARNAEIVRRQKAGQGPRSIARSVGVGPSVVAGVIYRAGLTDKASPHSKGRRGRGKLSAENIQTIRALCGAGMLQLRVAEKFGLHPATVTQILKRKIWAHVQ